ncbi:MAG: phytanoyl-CoA dioxygenase family protein [Proteobacteria bacterium]|nr:phytanoyl-CoA dioxygenase family protein [Pseudomonadota bacterium]
MKRSFERHGFLILENLLRPATCARLIRRMRKIVDRMDPFAKAAVFSTRDNPQSTERYFFESARQIRFFFEEGASDEKGRLKGDFRQSINKVGHALHDLDPEFDQFSRHEIFASIVANLGIAEPLLLQSMYIFKPPHIGGEVQYHQDATYLWTEPQSCLGLWVALEDATLDNGCLRGIPGSHLEPSPRRRYRRKSSEYRAEIEVLDSRIWPLDEAVPLEARCGSVIVLHGQFAHGSGPNRSEHSREAYSLHIVDGGCTYATDNWLQWTPKNRIRGFDIA